MQAIQPKAAVITISEGADAAEFRAFAHAWFADHSDQQLG